MNWFIYQYRNTEEYFMAFMLIEWAIYKTWTISCRVWRFICAQENQFGSSSKVFAGSHSGGSCVTSRRDEHVEFIHDHCWHSIIGVRPNPCQNQNNHPDYEHKYLMFDEVRVIFHLWCCVRSICVSVAAPARRLPHGVRLGVVLANHCSEHISHLTMFSRIPGY